ncbi:hypothetical protein [Halobacterium wangiae]|uniref:hypothetical protein n=1 Tax=Halobacterium wangiae TaxID=2902623 RepID=UPI001E49B32B|nr:hypothetical protein [Halobacterium wangiae]
MATQRQGQSIESFHVKSAALYGVAAYIAGLAATIVFLAVFVDSFDFDVFGIGATFFGAHNVSVGNGFMSLNVLNRLTTEYGSLELLWAVPPVLLAGAGKMFAETRAGRSLGPEEMDGAKAGALVAGGYAVLAVAGTFVFTEGETSAELVETLLYMGIVYPVVFGGIGGYLSR